MKRTPFFGDMASSALCLTLVILYSLIVPAVDAQTYIRDWDIQLAGGVSTLRWRPTANSPWYVFCLRLRLRILLN